MTYDVLKKFEDKAYDIDLNIGDQFIPATIHYPQNLVDAKVNDGTLKLVTRDERSDRVARAHEAFDEATRSGLSDAEARGDFENALATPEGGGELPQDHGTSDLDDESPAVAEV